MSLSKNGSHSKIKTDTPQALSIATRLVSRCRSKRLRCLSILDDVIIVAASLCGLGVIVLVSTAVDSGLGKRACLLISANVESVQINVESVQINVFIATMLFVLALSISKCSILLFLHEVAGNSMQKLGVMITGIVILMWTLAAIAGIVFECAMPRPWDIWSGKCIPLVSSSNPEHIVKCLTVAEVPFWIAVTAVDIVVDMTLVILSVRIVWARLVNSQKITATLVFSLRLL
jgi:hypothetical protein